MCSDQLVGVIYLDVHAKLRKDVQHRASFEVKRGDGVCIWYLRTSSNAECDEWTQIICQYARQDLLSTDNRNGFPWVGKLPLVESSPPMEGDRSRSSTVQTVSSSTITSTRAVSGSVIERKGPVADAKDKPTQQTLTVRVSGTEIKDDVAFFIVESRTSNRVSKRKFRFRQLNDMHNAVRNSDWIKDFRYLVPAFPPKKNKFFNNHSSAEFLQTRCKELNNYFDALVLVPKMSSNLSLLSALGLGQ